MLSKSPNRSIDRRIVPCRSACSRARSSFNISSANRRQLRTKSARIERAPLRTAHTGFGATTCVAFVHVANSVALARIACDLQRSRARRREHQSMIFVGSNQRKKETSRFPPILANQLRFSGPIPRRQDDLNYFVCCFRYSVSAPLYRGDTTYRNHCCVDHESRANSTSLQPEQNRKTA
jgi:hypothetical protein